MSIGTGFTTSRKRLVQRVGMAIKNRRVDCSQIRISDFVSNGNGHHEVKNSKELNRGDLMVFKAVNLGFMGYCQRR